ncbi:hypothetical protein ACFROC_25705 [Nocardia tengchongensis]|uniref:hypothetical protein n=1 Tax=Nocardia tengchongensis TaxID=2055889 RepID=UPI0036B29B86
MTHPREGREPASTDSEDPASAGDPGIEAIAHIPGLHGEHLREWRQFARWAAAAEYPALPASASTVLSYLAEHPGTSATQRGRVTALNAAHTLTAHPIPGAAETVRRALNPQRAARLTVLAERADILIANMPIHGWPEALTARRDAVILLCATAGLSWHQISSLRQHQVTVTDTAVTIGAQPLAELPATARPDTCPVQVFRRWAQVLTHAPAATGHIRLEELLAEPDPDMTPSASMPERYRDQPLLCDFDHRGLAVGVIDELDPLSADQIAAITTTRFQGPARRTGNCAELDPNYYERGIAARLRDRTVLSEIDDLLDRFDDILADFDID